MLLSQRNDTEPLSAKDVLRLGMRVRHQKARCWRPERHAHRDADPSLCFSVHRNRVRCMVCDTQGGHSCIDLVARVLAVDTGTAVRWIAERFAVPNVKVGRPLGAGQRGLSPYQVGLHASPFEVLVKSGMFGALSAAGRSILVCLETFKDHESGLTRLSYQAIQRYAGVSSRTTVSKALKFLQQIRALQISRGARVGLIRECSVYRATLEDEKFIDRCNEIYTAKRAEISREREYRKQLKAARERDARQIRNLNTNPAGGLRVPRTPSLTVSRTPTTQKEEQSKANLKVQNLSTPSGPHANKPVHANYRLIGVPAFRDGKLLRSWKGPCA
jgi:hypothetical protein